MAFMIGFMIGGVFGVLIMAAVSAGKDRENR